MEPDRRRSRRPGIVATIVALGLVAPWRAQPVRAGEFEENRQLAEAESACLAGDYARGVELLSDLYLKGRHPAYLHNQARCYEQNGQYRLAVVRYRAFLLKVNELSTAERADEGLDDGKIKKIEAQLSRVEQLAQSQPPTGDEGGVAARRPDAPESSALHQNAGSTPGSPRGAGLRTAGVVGLSLAGVAVVGGAIAGAMARNAETEISQTSQRMGVFDPELYDRGRRASTISTASFIAAPVLLGLGALAYWMGRSMAKGERNGSGQSARRNDHPALHVGPTLSLDGVGGLAVLEY
jgi:hypothetical protein